VSTIKETSRLLLLSKEECKSRNYTKMRISLFLVFTKSV